MVIKSNKILSWEPSVINGPILHLIQRLSLGPHSPPIQIITFIAARAQEGTSTIAREYATLLATETNQKVLLIDAGVQTHKNASPGIVDTVIAGRSPHDAIHAQGHGISLTHWIGNDKNRTASGQVIHNTIFWKTLCVSFDTIIIDAPSLQSAFDGINLAAKADATVLVVEAEETPEPVIRNLRDTVSSAGAKIAGIVMNKRRYHIPHKVYQRL